MQGKCREGSEKREGWWEEEGGEENSPAPSSLGGLRAVNQT